MQRKETRPVPWRIIFAVVGVVLTVAGGLMLLLLLKKIVTWVLVAMFFAVILNPVVDLLQRRIHVRRGLAATIVFFVGIAVMAGMLYAFIKPIVDQSNQFADKFPSYVDDAQNGRGTIGKFLKKHKIDRYLKKNKKKFQDSLRNAGKPALKVARSVANTLVALITILVLSFLMLLEGPEMLTGGLNALSPPRRERLQRVGADCAKALTGYMAGNLAISVIAGVAVYIFLFFAHVPFREVQALWVAFADLIPLVGATLGAVPVIAVSFIHSVPAGIATIVFFIIYQQFENHVLQVTIMARTVDLKPLVVLISVLIGVELFGILGALLAIPVAGVIQVIVRDVWDTRRGRFKPEPTIGTDEVPVSELPDAVDAL